MARHPGDHTVRQGAPAVRRSGQRESWENRTVEDYLGALAAWITDSPGSYRYLGEEMPPDGDWTFFARALSAAVVYE